MASVDGYDEVHGGYGFGVRNVDGERVLEFCDAVSMAVTNTWFCLLYTSDAADE